MNEMKTPLLAKSPASAHTLSCDHDPALFHVETSLAMALESGELYAATGTHYDTPCALAQDVAFLLAGMPQGRAKEVAGALVDAGRAYVLALRGPDTVTGEDRRHLRQALQRLAWDAAHEHVAGFAAAVRATA